MDNQEIGQNAISIWSTLDTKGEMQIAKLKKLSKLSTENFNLALGWLIRGDNITIYEKNLQKWIHLNY